MNIDDECLFETYDRINDVESAIQLLTLYSHLPKEKVIELQKPMTANTAK